MAAKAFPIKAAVPRESARPEKCRGSLDPNRRSVEAEQLERDLLQHVVGQAEAIEAVVEIYEISLSGLNSPGRPISNMLFLGPTGTGKTHLVEAVAEALFGTPDAIIKIDCGEFQHEHEIAKLVGSPPGYVGHGATPPLLCQERLNQWHTEKNKISLLLFDEIEKAHEALWQLLLGILDKATITLGDNRRVDFSRCMVFMTSNLGTTEMSALVSGGLGFAPDQRASAAELEQKITRVAIEAARRRFSPEFINRLDRIAVFKSLQREQLQRIVELELEAVRRLIDRTAKPFWFCCTPKVKHFLLDHGTEPRYGARPLKRVIEHYITFPLANLVATGQIEKGDTVVIDMSGGSFKFVVACMCAACRCGDTASCCRGVRESPGEISGDVPKRAQLM